MFNTWECAGRAGNPAFLENELAGHRAIHEAAKIDCYGGTAQQRAPRNAGVGRFPVV